MFARTALRSAARPAQASLRRDAVAHSRPLHLAPRLRPTAYSGSFKSAYEAATAVAFGVSVLALAQLWPEWVPSPAPLHAEAAAANSEVYYDPTTATPFPQHLSAPDGTALRLVGTGVRTVSFLNIRVYAAGFYVSQRELDQLYAGKLGPDWTGFTPERLIPPFASGGTEQQQPKGEVLMESLLEKADTAVIIIPLRNTSLAHLRDGFSRALVARMKVPRVSNEFTDSMNEATGAALVDFKSFFPPRSLAKGMPLELYYSARNRDVTFQLRDEKTRSPQVLGTLRDAVLARELMVSYFSDSAAPSRELVVSAAMGLARQPGSPTGPATVAEPAA